MTTEANDHLSSFHDEKPKKQQRQSSAAAQKPALQRIAHQ